MGPLLSARQHMHAYDGLEKPLRDALKQTPHELDACALEELARGGAGEAAGANAGGSGSPNVCGRRGRQRQGTSKRREMCASVGPNEHRAEGKWRPNDTHTGEETTMADANKKGYRDWYMSTRRAVMFGFGPGTTGWLKRIAGALETGNDALRCERAQEARRHIEECVGERDFVRYVFEQYAFER